MKRTFLFPLILICIVLSSCRPSGTTTESGDYVERDGIIYYKGTKTNDIVAHLLSEPASLHPMNSTYRSRTYVNGMVYERLLTIDIKTGEMVPQLAVGLPEVSGDGLTYTFEIKPNAAWNDGAAITARDVLFTLKAALSPLTENAALKTFLEYIKDVRLDPNNPRKIDIEMREYYINNDNLGIALNILDPRHFDASGTLEKFSISDLIDANSKVSEDPDLIAWANNFNDNKYGREIDALNAGSGPYVFEDWIPEQQIILKRNPNYWGANEASYLFHQKPDRIIFKILRDDKAVELQVKQEEMDVVDLSSQAYHALKDNELVNQNYRIEMVPRPTFAAIMLNCRPDGINQQKVLVDKRVRNAIAMAIPLDDIIEQYFATTVVRVSSPISSNHPDFNDKLPTVPYDHQQAMGLLEEAGWTDTDGDLIRDKVVDGKKIPLSFSLYYPPNSQDIIDMVERVKLELAQIGVECKPISESMGSFSRKVLAHDYDAAMFALTAGSPIPYDFKQLFHSDSWNGGSNFTGFSNQEADRLIDRSRVERDPVARKKMVDRIQEIIFEEQPMLFFYSPTKKLAIHRRFNHATVNSIPDYVTLNEMEMIRE